MMGFCTVSGHVNTSNHFSTVNTMRPLHEIPKVAEFKIILTPKNCAPGDQKLAWKNLQQLRLEDPILVKHDTLQEAG